MSAIKKLTQLFLALALLVAALGFAAQPALAAECTQYHTVKRGETLYSIGLQYGVTWKYLAEINNLEDPGLIYAGQKLCVSQQGTVTPPPAGTIPTFRITGVVKDVSVSIETANLPANDRFDVLMGAYGTKGVNGTKVGTLDSGAGGKLTATYNIPAGLKGAQRIAIRLESPNSGYFAYNWFWNNTSGGSGTGGGQTPSGYTGIPTFSIAAVVADQSVTIRTKNFPANLEFVVLMGEMGTRGVGGIEVARVNSGKGGEFTATYAIPAALKGDYQIAIRLENRTGAGYFAYNWFYNSTTN